MAGIQRSCETCGENFTASPSKVRQGKGRFCKKACFDIAQSPSLEEKFWPNVTKSEGCWIYRNLNSSGYGQMGHRGKMLGAHRVSWEIHNGQPPGKNWVLHRCDNPPCVNPDHLFLGDAQANTADMMAKGRADFGGYPEGRRVPRGEEIRQGRLMESDIVPIRLRFAAGESMRSIARSHSVTHEAIRKVVRLESWTHI